MQGYQYNFSLRSDSNMAYRIFCDVGWVFFSMSSRLQSDPDHTGLGDLQIPFILLRKMQSPSELSLKNRAKTGSESAVVPAVEIQMSTPCQAASLLSAPSFQHMRTAGSCAFTIPSLKDVRPSCTTLPFRTASQRALTTRPLNRPKPALSGDQLGVLHPGRDQMHLEAFLNTSFWPISTRVQLTNSATMTTAHPVLSKRSQQIPAQVTGSGTWQGTSAMGSYSPSHLQPPSQPLSQPPRLPKKGTPARHESLQHGFA